MRGLEAAAIIVGGVILGTVLGPVANDVVHDFAFDPTAGKVNRDAAMWAAATGVVVQGSVWVFSFYLAMKQNRAKPDNMPASVASSDKNYGSETARMAAAVEAELLNAITALGQLHLHNYRTMYAWGTEGGNHIFDQVQTRTVQEGLGEADIYILVLIYMALQARVDENDLMVVAFKSIIAATTERIGKHLSIQVLAEVTALELADTELLFEIEMSKQIDAVVSSDTSYGSQTAKSAQEADCQAEKERQRLEADNKAEENLRREAASEMHAKKTEHELPARPSIAEQSQVVDTTSVPLFAKAWKVIDYSDAAASAWEDIKSLPEEYQQRFLASLDQEPTLDVGPLAAQLIADRAKELRPYDDDDANDSLEQARTISVAAEQEFREVYDMLGSKLAPSEILKKVESKFGPSAKTTAERERQLSDEERKAEERKAEERQRWETDRQRRNAEHERQRREDERREDERREKLETARMGNAKLAIAIIATLLLIFFVL